MGSRGRVCGKRNSSESERVRFGGKRVHQGVREEGLGKEESIKKSE